MKIVFIILYIFQAVGYAKHVESDAGGFFSGIIHPLMGIDHVIAIIGVAIWSYQISKSSIWILPLAFLIAMLIGAGIGIIAIPLYSVEIVIAFSGIFLGLFIVMDEKFPLWVSIPVVSIFALFHGYAHGVELPLTSTPIMYMLGFSITVALLMIFGIVVATILKKLSYKEIGTRVLGISIIIIGAIVLTNILID